MKNDNNNLTQQAENNGFIPAITPTTATAITTDNAHIITKEALVPTQGENMPVWYACPKEGCQPFPVVLVIQEIFGVHEYIRDICRRLAVAGYFAVAPQLYFRQGEASAYSDISTLLSELVSKVPDTQVLADLDHVANWASGQGGDMRNMAITGFCWGGRIVWLYAAHNPQLKAGVAWYGKLVGEKSLKQPEHPADIASRLNAPVLGLYGGLDSSISQESIETMRQALHASSVRTEIVVYPEAGHAFHADYRPSYHEASARDGWQRMLAWFKQHGVAPKT